MTAFSKPSLRDKLGLKPGRAALVRIPENLRADLGNLDDIAPITRVGGVPFDFILACITSREQLEAVLPNLVTHLKSDGMLWLAWTKQASPLHAGLTEDVIRSQGLAAGLVDVKVAALNADWSGLKFVYRLADRQHGRVKSG